MKSRRHISDICPCIASYAEARYIDVVKRLLVVTLTAALFVVPTVMRARQHVEMHDTTRISIRLNWQGEKRCHDDVELKSDERADETPLLFADLPELQAFSHLSARQRAVDVALPASPADNAPDPLRGPPSVSL